jgi:membrane peptidoglycan carboxypeptidase
LAQNVVRDGVAKIANDFNAHDGALVSLDPKTGEVLAMVGAWNTADESVNRRNLAYEQRQPGSTIKLFTYTTAIASRQFTMTTPIVDAPVTYQLGPGGGTYSPKNYDHSFHGTCQLQRCLGNSFNVPAVKTEAKVGIPMITDLEIAAGLRSLGQNCPNVYPPASNRPGPLQYAATLGGLACGITPLELADGVATIADMGVQHDPTPVVRITDRSSGKVVYAHDPKREGRRVIPADVAFIMAEITSNDHNRYTEFGPNGDLTLKDRRVSAKTGTTENFSSNWTVGWTPQLVGVVFVANPNGSCLKGEDYAKMGHILASRHSDVDVYNYSFSADEVRQSGLQPLPPPCGPLRGSTGITGAAPIWNGYMRQALVGYPKDWYTKPADVISDGHGDDADFFLPGTQSQSSCYYYAPAPDPSSACSYSGTSPPPPPPSPLPATGGPPPQPPPAPPPTNTPKPHG